MLRESDFPGLVRVYRNDGSIELCWAAEPAAIDAGFTPKIVRLDYPDWSADLAKCCQDLELQMAAWLAGRENRGKPIVFDGTIGGLLKIYVTHPASPFHEKRTTTQRAYRCNLQHLDRAIGRCRLSVLDGVDFRRWHRRFKEPQHEGGPERISRAHHYVDTLRIVLSFGVELGLPHAKRLRDALSVIRFPNSRTASGRPLLPSSELSMDETD